MQGLGGEYVYHECGHCGSLWLADPPDLAPFYGDGYYSFQGNGLLGRAIEDRHAAQLLSHTSRFGVRPGRDDRILDVGCGRGAMLSGLRRRGYKRASGIDPFVPESTELVVRGQIGDVVEPCKLIVFNHSLEHVLSVEETLRTARDRLCEGGSILVRIPVPNHAWRTYGVHWFGLDAPRHVHLMTERGLRALATRIGLSMANVAYDAGPNHFWGSEAYARGQTLAQAQPTSPIPLALHIAGRVRWLPKVKALNRRGLSDQAAFLLVRAHDELR